MKALKLMGVFVLIVGIIAGAIYLPNLIDRLDSDRVETDDVTLKTLVDNIDKEWEIEQRWNKDLYKSHRNLISQYKSDLSEDASKLALDGLDIKASKILWSEIKKEFAKRDCSYKKVLTLQDGANYVKKKSTAPNADMDELQKSVSTYRTIYYFAKSAHKCNVKFDGDRWSTDVKKNRKSAEYKSFAEYERDILSYRENHINNIYYKKYLNGITELKNGLNEKNVKDKLAKARESFYNDLTNLIISYYEQVERTSENWERLKNCKVSNEMGYTPENLRSFMKEFKNSVNESRGIEL